jgi:hypothetical protein
MRENKSYCENYQMKLARLVPMIFPLAASFMLIGCKPKTTIEQFIAKCNASRAIRVTFDVKAEANSGRYTIAIKKGEKGSLIRMSATTTGFRLVANEKEGCIELDEKEKEYLFLPYNGSFFAGTGRVFPPRFTGASPVIGASPFQYNPLTKWKKTVVGNGEQWATEIDGQQGPIDIVMKLSKDGDLEEFRFDQDEVKIIKFEYLDDLAISEFKVDIPDGYTAHTNVVEPIMVRPGSKFDASQFTAKGKYAGYRHNGFTVYAFIDPTEASSAFANKWATGVGTKYNRVPVIYGDAKDGLCDVEKALLYNIVPSTPFFLLVNPQGVVVGLWNGLNAASEPTMEREIREILMEES